MKFLNSIGKALMYPILNIKFSWWLNQFLVPFEAKKNGFVPAISRKRYEYAHRIFGHSTGNILYLNGERSTLKLEFFKEDFDQFTIQLLSKKFRPIKSNHEVSIDLNKEQVVDMVKFLEDNLDVKGKEVAIEEKDEYIFTCDCHSIEDIILVSPFIEEEYNSLDIRAMLNWNSSCIIMIHQSEIILYSIIKNYLKRLEESKTKGKSIETNHEQDIIDLQGNVKFIAERIANLIIEMAKLEKEINDIKSGIDFIKSFDEDKLKNN